MARIREFEERVKGTFEEHPGAIRGHTHLADGAEASIVGSLATLRDGDQVLATYRCHGYPIALGSDTQGADGRDLRQVDRHLRRLRRLDAPRRRRARLPRHLRDRRAGDPARDRRRLRGPDPQAGPGRALVLRRRRLQAGRLRRVAEHRLAVEAPDRLRHGEQQLQRRHALRAGGRQRRRRRAARGQGQGGQHARRDRRRRRPARGLRRRRRRRSSARAQARGPRSWSRRSTG